MIRKVVSWYEKIQKTHHPFINASRFCVQYFLGLHYILIHNRFIVTDWIQVDTGWKFSWDVKAPIWTDHHVVLYDKHLILISIKET